MSAALSELLSTAKRREVAERIKHAREFGDISENSEYDDAKNEQAMLEKQIADLEEKLRGARVIDEKSVDTDVVGTAVLLRSMAGPRSRDHQRCARRRALPQGAIDALVGSVARPEVVARQHDHLRLR